jgi:SAM-dependent methyltransferase
MGPAEEKSAISARASVAIEALRGQAGLVDRLLRVDGPELLDLAGTPAIIKQRILADVERISRYLGLYQLWVHRVGKMIVEARRTRRGKPVRVLDVGAGSGGLLFRIDDWARRRRIPVELFGIDSSEAAIASCERRAGEEGRRVELELGDARSIAVEVDVTVNTFVLHHLTAGDVANALHEIDRVSAVNFFVFDLRRTLPALPALWALLHAARFDAPTRHDSVVSLRKGYTPDELTALLRAAGVVNFNVAPIPPAFVAVTRA